MSGDAHIAPEADFSDGFFQLQFMRQHGRVPVGRWQLLLYLLGLDTGAHQTAEHVEMMPSRAYRLEPLPNHVFDVICKCVLYLNVLQ